MNNDAKTIADLLKEWRKILARYTSQADMDLPYWHSERANVGFLAAAVWKSGGVAIEEYWTEREKKGKKPVKGWVDLWGKMKKGREFSLEAKQLWLSKLDYEKINTQLLRFHRSMDKVSGRSYRGKPGGDNETSWHTPAVGKPAAQGRPALETRPRLPRSSRETGRVDKLPGPVAASLPQEGVGRLKTQTPPRKTFASFRQTEEGFGAPFGKRPLGSRFLDRRLDLETDRQGGTQAFSSRLLSLKPLVSNGRFGLELSGADQESQGKTRSGNPILEASRLASYKKKPLGLEPAWFSWTKADSRLSRISRKRGRLRAELRDLQSQDAGLKSRPSLPSASRPKENVSDFTPAFTLTKTFEPLRSENLSGTWGATFPASSFFSGTKALSTEPSSFGKSLKAILESKPFTSQDTRPSLTPMNWFGIISSGASQTVSPTTWGILDDSLTDRLENFGTRKGSSVPAFMHLTYLGHDSYPLLSETSVACCLEDLKSNSWHTKEMQVSVCFLSLRTQDIRRLSKNWLIEEVNEMSRKYHMKNIVIESYFPPKEIIINRKFKEDGTDCYYPGVIAVARIEK